MGADGHYLMVREQDFRQEFPDVEPSELGLMARSVLGTSALTAYYDTEGRDDLDAWHRSTPLTERQKEAIRWFEAQAEDHLVWT